MEDIFKDLKSFGFKDSEDVQIFKKASEKVATPEEKKVIVPTEDLLLYDGKKTCPVCSNEFSDRMVKTAKVRLSKTDLDLRPVYEIIDPSKYDVVICNQCGYAALRKVFHQITPNKIALIKKKISPHFIGKEYPFVFSYDIALERFKLALYDAIAMEAKDSEKAYICLKIAWLYRGKADQNLDLEDSKSNEVRFIQHAIEGFIKTVEFERFPVLDLDENTVEYLIGELSRRAGLFDQSMFWLSKVIMHEKASRRLKERARDSKDLVKTKSCD